MKVLFCSKFHFQRGGKRTHLHTLQRILAGKGHEAGLFSPERDGNRPVPAHSAFVPAPDYVVPKLDKTLRGTFLTARRSIRAVVLVVQILHDCKWLSLDTSMLCGGRGCDDCADRPFRHCAAGRERVRKGFFPSVYRRRFTAFHMLLPPVRRLARRIGVLLPPAEKDAQV